MFIVKDGDIFEGTEDYLCHQANCVSVGPAAGIAAAIYYKYPYSDIYRDRKTPNVPGHAIVCYNKGSRTIVNLLGQLYPGSSMPSSADSAEDRIVFFRKALWDMVKQLGPGSYAFPWRVGCGIAGGDWGIYITILKNFEAFMNKTYTKGDVIIYRLPETRPVSETE